MTTEQRTHDTRQPHINIVRVDHGWEIREERDGVIVHVTHHTDWHRVERSLQLLERWWQPREEPS